jgi:hypothetical protein
MGKENSKSAKKSTESAAAEPEPEPTKKQRGRKAPQQEAEPVVDEEDRPDPHQEDTGDAEPDADAKRRAKCRGYRQVAKKAGFSAAYDSGFSHLDVATPVLSEAEVIRACKWVPRMESEAAFSGIEEFEERSRLQHHSLAPSTARVFRAHSEAYLRKLVSNCVQRASDNQNTRVTIKEVVAELRPLQRVQKYTFVAPEGLVQYAINKTTGEHLDPSTHDEEPATKKELKALIAKQKKVPEKLSKKYEAEKTEAAELRAAKAAKRSAAKQGATKTISKKGAGVAA